MVHLELQQLVTGTVPSTVLCTQKTHTRTLRVHIVTHKIIFLEGDKVQSLRQGSPSLLLGSYYPVDFSSNLASIIKGALTKFCQTMLIFESSKTNTPIPQTGPRPYFEISAPNVRTQPWKWRLRKQVKMTHKHIQSKANTDKLCETMQNQCYPPIKKKQHNLGIRFQAFPLLEFSPLLESCSDIYMGLDCNPSI